MQNTFRSGQRLTFSSPNDTAELQKNGSGWFNTLERLSQSLDFNPWQYLHMLHTQHKTSSCSWSSNSKEKSLVLLQVFILCEKIIFWSYRITSQSLEKHNSSTMVEEAFFWLIMMRKALYKCNIYILHNRSLYGFLSSSFLHPNPNQLDSYSGTLCSALICWEQAERTTKTSLHEQNVIFFSVVVRKIFSILLGVCGKI